MENRGEMFEKQMEMVGSLRHPNLVPMRAYFQAMGERLVIYDYQPNGSLFNLVHETIKPPSTSTGEFPIGQEQLASISRDHDTTALQQYGGVAGISNLLKTRLEKGIHGDDVDLRKQRNSFGSNNYPRKKGRGFFDVYVGCLQGSNLGYFNGS